METDYIVGVDAGGTRTRLRFATPQGRTLADHRRPAGEWTALDAGGKAAQLAAGLRAVTGRPPLAVAVAPTAATRTRSAARCVKPSRRGPASR
ncbi:hypothetical protein [Streptomyces sp. SA3_actF]|uniref:hypothetical protein n=1 Tax=Streptomyces sp. SA3_actF TaxID=682181 RepID=UPI0001FFFA2D|nr:hypothetical protein [Streptomyces sp. SA3_actF]